MILNKENAETDLFLDINNDIYRIVSTFDKNQKIKKLLSYSDFNPLNDREDIVDELKDKQILRVPVIPFNENEGSICVLTVIKGEIQSDNSTAEAMLAIDVFTPINQWIISDGIRPLLLSHEINNSIKNDFSQTGGIKYRLTSFVSAQLTDDLLGYRLIFGAVIDD